MSRVADDSPYGRFRNWLGHYAVPAGIAILVLDAVNRLTPSTWWNLVATGGLVFLLLTWFSGTTRHDTVMCLQCATEIDDGDIERRRGALAWYHHLAYSPKNMLLYLVVPVLAISWLPVVGLIFDASDSIQWLLRIASFFGGVPYVIFAYYVRTHHRMRPWCPFCRDWEDGGATEQVPDPDPTGQKSA